MIKKIKKYIEDNQLINEGDYIAVGISGGADSVCLLLVLWELSQEMNFTVQPVHINHNLRGEESLEDEKFVQNLCEKLGLPCIIESTNIIEHANKQGLSIEEAGRNVRREILQKVVQAMKQGKISLGHHLNDNVETGLFHLLRGTGIRGMAGMKAKTGNCIRPLLAVSKKDIEAYLEEQGQEYRTDSSNLENIYTRNKIRNKILPILQEEVNPKAPEHIQQFMEELEEIEEYVQGEVAAAWKNLDLTNTEEIEIPNHICINQQPLILRQIIKKAIGTLLGSEKNITRAHIQIVESLFQMEVGKQNNLPQGLLAKRSYIGVVLSTQENTELREGICCIELKLSGQTKVNNNLVIETEILPYNGQKSFEENDYTKYFDYDIIRDKLYIDQVKGTDCLIFNKEGNSQSIKKYCKNNKIPAGKREALLGIRYKQEILWLLGYRKGLTANISADTTTILKIQIGGEDNGR